MKKVLLIILTVLASSAPAFCAEPVKITPPALNIREATNAQMARYGRELYRKGDFTGSAQVFERLLQIDCQNKLAQYHLQKIAAKGDAFKDVAEFLKNLPCPKHDFSQEDFLPSSLYYENDADLVLEQLLAYNKRYRESKAQLAGQIERYKDMITQLETKTDELSTALTSAQKDAAQVEGLQSQLAASQALSARLNEESEQLKAQLEVSRTEYEKEAAALEEKTASSENDTETKRALIKHKDDIFQKTQELATLEEKFARLQERLRQIESAIAQNNADIKTVQKDLSTIPE